MPFSFKPNQSQQDSSASSSSIASSPSISIPAGSPQMAVRLQNSKTSIVQVLLYVAFGIAVAISVALFAYSKYLLSTIAEQKQVLDQKDAGLGTLNLQAMKDLSSRMKVVNQVIGEHASVTSALTILEKTIEYPVTYTRFSLTRKDGVQGYDVQVSAIAPSYKAVAQQMDTLKSDVFKDLMQKVTYDGLNLDGSGHVGFTIKMQALIQGKLPEDILVKDPYAVQQTQVATTSQVTTSQATTTLTQTVSVVASSTKQGTSSTSSTTKP